MTNPLLGSNYRELQMLTPARPKILPSTAIDEDHDGRNRDFRPQIEAPDMRRVNWAFRILWAVLIAVPFVLWAVSP